MKRTSRSVPSREARSILAAWSCMLVKYMYLWQQGMAAVGKEQALEALIACLAPAQPDPTAVQSAAPASHSWYYRLMSQTSCGNSVPQIYAILGSHDVSLFENGVFENMRIEMKSLCERVDPESSERLLKRNRDGHRAQKDSMVRGEVWNDGAGQGTSAATTDDRMSHIASKEGALAITVLWTSGL